MMSDMAKCPGKGCDKRETCARWWENHPKSTRHLWVASFYEEKPCTHYIKEVVNEQSSYFQNGNN